LAVLKSLRARRADADVRWVGGHRGLEGDVVHAEGIPFERLLLRSLRTVDLSVQTVIDPLRLLLSLPQALAALVRWRPAAIFTTGGYVALPVVIAAAALRVPVLLWEGNVVPGRSARVTARFAAAIAVAFSATCAALRGTCYATGTPVRSFADRDRAAARARLGLAADPPCVLIFGGSQAVRRFDAAVDAALPQLVARVSVVHITGESAFAGAVRRRDALPQDQRERYRPFAFLGEEMADALAAADLVIGRAGSSTLAEATAIGRPLVVVPYPHAAGHQRANARLLADAGAARLIADEAFDGAALLDAVRILDDDARLELMGAASRAFGRPGAADAVAELVLALAERRALPSPAAVERLAQGAA
jgi:UDP-N-acetylglucosamine--N-acetylmuramyl-(pentapeptide) pyrophosphoryl-undecaprenol N-acetylglucosamine transferase